MARGRKPSSGYKGVAKYNSRWRAEIYVGDGIRKHLGTFDTPEEAKLVYDRAKRQLDEELIIKNYEKAKEDYEKLIAGTYWDEDLY